MRQDPIPNNIDASSILATPAAQRSHLLREHLTPAPLLFDIKLFQSDGSLASIRYFARRLDDQGFQSLDVWHFTSASLHFVPVRWLLGLD